LSQKDALIGGLKLSNSSSIWHFAMTRESVPTPDFHEPITIVGLRVRLEHGKIGSIPLKDPDFEKIPSKDSSLEN
jgi:hypothetical protein